MKSGVLIHYVVPKTREYNELVLTQCEAGLPENSVRQRVERITDRVKHKMMVME